MEIEKLLTFGIEYLSDYTKTFFETLSKPRLLFAPTLVENKIATQSQGEYKTILNPKLFSYAIISMTIGLTIQSAIPSWNDIRTNAGITSTVGLSASTGIIILIVWLLYAAIASGVFYKILKGVSFFELISVNLQIISTQYVLSCFLTLAWAVIYRNFIFHEYFVFYSPDFIKMLGDTPSYLYFGLQFLLLSLFVPVAIINTFSPTKKTYVYRAVFLLIFVTAIFVVFNYGLWSESGSLSGAGGQGK